MSCYHPRPAYECVDVITGEVSFFLWNVPPGVRPLKALKVPCNQCIGCRDKYTRAWALRCEHESLYHKENCFLTLTVSDDHIDQVFPGSSLQYGPFQLFFRSLRKRLKRKGLKFFMCGEYGEQFGRPHYHAIVFGWFPSSDDRFFYKDTAVGPLYTSRIISELWPYGNHTVGNFSRETAGYVAGYVQKKINGKMKEAWYGSRCPEFARMSNRGCITGRCKKLHGIGGCYYKDFKKDMYNARDGVTLRGGVQVAVPRYYDKLHSFYHPSHMEKLKVKRSLPDPVRDRESTPEKLKIREVIHRSRRKADRNNFGGGV